MNTNLESDRIYQSIIWAECFRKPAGLLSLLWQTYFRALADEAKASAIAKWECA